MLVCHNDLMSFACPATIGCPDDCVDCIDADDTLACDDAAVGAAGVGAHPTMTRIAAIEMIEMIDFI